MPSFNQCFYKDCTNSKKSHPELSFHRFPQDKQRLLVWIERSGCDVPMDEDLKKWKNRLVCSSHFNPFDFKDGARPILKEKAVPRNYSWHIEEQTLDENDTEKQLHPELIIVKEEILNDHQFYHENIEFEQQLNQEIIKVKEEVLDEHKIIDVPIDIKHEIIKVKEELLDEYIIHNDSMTQKHYLQTELIKIKEEVLDEQEIKDPLSF